MGTLTSGIVSRQMTRLSLSNHMNVLRLSSVIHKFLILSLSLYISLLTPCTQVVSLNVHTVTITNVLTRMFMFNSLKG